MLLKGKTMNAPFGGSSATEAIRMWFESLAKVVLNPLPSFQLATFCDLKMREVLPYQVRYITVNDNSGQDWSAGFLLQQFSGRWLVKMHGIRPASSEEEPPRLQSHPWVGLECQWLGQDFTAFGEVFEKGIALGRARLLDGADFVLEDTVEHGIVLFVANNVPTVPPLRLELHDTQGRLVSRLVYRERAFPWVDEQEK